MFERQPDPAIAPAAESPDPDKPVVQSQDLEHQPSRDTRVNNAGVEVQPPSIEGRPVTDEEIAEEDRASREAIAAFERSIARQPPG